MVQLRFSEYRQNTNVKFSVDPSKYTIARLDSVPAMSDKVFAIVRDQQEVTVVAKEGFVSQPTAVEGFFKRITFDVALPYDLVGFVAYVYKESEPSPPPPTPVPVPTVAPAAP